MKTAGIIFTVLLLVTNVIQGQDNIVKRNGDVIKARVQEVGTVEIKYKKFDNLNGPTYDIAKADVFMIMYENGSKDVFDAPAQTPAPAQTVTPVQTPAAPPAPTPSPATALPPAPESSEATPQPNKQNYQAQYDDMMKKARKKKGWGTFWIIWGIIDMGGGAGLLGAGINSVYVYDSYGNVTGMENNKVWVGCGAAVLGVGYLELLGGCIQVASGRKLQKSAQQYLNHVSLLPEIGAWRYPTASTMGYKAGVNLTVRF